MPNKINKAQFAQVMQENPQLPNEPDQDYGDRLMSAVDVALPMLLRVGGAIGGGLLGAVGGIPGIMAGGAVGGSAGEGLAQAYETQRGLREEFNPAQIATQGALSAIPIGGRVPSIGRYLMQGAGLGGGSTVATSLAETGEMPSVPEFLLGTGLGGAMGAGTGKLAQRGMSRAAMDIRTKQTAATPWETELDPLLAVHKGEAIPASQTYWKRARTLRDLEGKKPPVPEAQVEFQYAGEGKPQRELFEVREAGTKAPFRSPRLTPEESKASPIVARGFKNIAGHDSSAIAKARRDAGIGGWGKSAPADDELTDMATRGIEGISWYESIGPKGYEKVYGAGSPHARLSARQMAATSANRPVAPENIDTATYLTERMRMAGGEVGATPTGIPAGKSAEPNIRKLVRDFYNDVTQSATRLRQEKIGGFDRALTNPIDVASGRAIKQGKAVVDRHMMALYGFDPSDQNILKFNYAGNTQGRGGIGEIVRSRTGYKQFWKDLFTDKNGTFHEDLYKQHTRPAPRVKYAKTLQRTERVNKKTGKVTIRWIQEPVMNKHGEQIVIARKGDRIGTTYDYIAGDLALRARSAADDIRIPVSRDQTQSLREVIGRDLNVHEYQSMVWNGVRTKSQAGGVYEDPARLILDMASDPNIPLPLNPRMEALAKGVKRIPRFMPVKKLPKSGYIGMGRPASDVGASYGDIPGMRFSGALPSDRKIVNDLVKKTLTGSQKPVHTRLRFDKGSGEYIAETISPKKPTRYIATKRGKKPDPKFRKHELRYKAKYDPKLDPKSISSSKEVVLKNKEDLKKEITNFLNVNTHLLTDMTTDFPSATRPFLRTTYNKASKKVLLEIAVDDAK